MISKEFVEKKGKVVCRVTFALPTQMWAESIYVVGDFDGWDQSDHKFRRLADGSYSITLELDCRRTYEFRYLDEGGIWLNDNRADGFVPNPFGTTNCLLITDPADKPD
jgi:hypothetical protein